jgi:two-component system, OmpR family, phosphate regulon sensor histidine kinase PhoR
VVQRLVTGVTEAKEAALGPREVSSAVLSPPLQDLRLVAVAEGEDPVAEASARNRTVYVALLVLFYLILAIGVVLTGRALYREAKLSRLKTDFVSLVSHELRTPLTSIRMFIETLAMGRVRDTQETQAVLDMLSKETARLSSMIENVLDWARIESGRKQYSRAPTPVVAVVEAAVAAFRAQRVGAAMDFSVAVDDGLPKIEVDQEAVAGALLNLLQNAFKYTGEDKRIRLRARKEGAGVAIDVGDNGTGIAPRDKKRIFERFYRADNLLTRQTEGTGLGLSIAQRIAIAHHGKITVESTLGQGSTFSLHLPPAREVVSG